MCKCHTKQQIVLNQSIDAQISWCRICETYTLVYKNCLLVFNPKTIWQFQYMLANLELADFHFTINGDQYAIIRRKKTQSGISLKQKDASLLLKLIVEATLIKDAYKIIEN